MAIDVLPRHSLRALRYACAGITAAGRLYLGEARKIRIAQHQADNRMRDDSALSIENEADAPLPDLGLEQD